jgi:hypothetical protein
VLDDEVAMAVALGFLLAKRVVTGSYRVEREGGMWTTKKTFWLDLVRFGWIWCDLVGFGEIWYDEP